MHNHLGIYISNSTDKESVLEHLTSGSWFPKLKRAKVAVFSEITLNAYIDEEMRHGRLLIPSEQQSLKNASEGERKKALLNHILSTQLPEYLILDNVFDGLDVACQAHVKQIFEERQKHVAIIQISTRKHEFFSFIKAIYSPKGDKLELYANNSSTRHITTNFKNPLPKPYKATHNNSNPLISLTNITVNYLDKPILNNISWDINPGEFWQLLGPNGSGKSTLLSLITGDNPKGYGQDMLLFGMKKGSGESVWDIKQHIGFYSSELLRGFKKSETIEGMVISGFLDSVGLYTYPTDIQIKIANDWLDILGMLAIKTKSFQFLSNGHKRLVLIARAMVKQPPLLILDEPTNGLDDADTIILSALINKIAKETKTAIIYVSHREESGISPDFIFELRPSKAGSIGYVRKK